MVRVWPAAASAFDDGPFRRCPDLQLIRDLADATKHGGELHRRSVIVKAISGCGSPGGTRSRGRPRISSLPLHFEGLTGAQAALLMEQHADKALLLRESGKPTAADHEALRTFQIRTGKRLVRH